LAPFRHTHKADNDDHEPEHDLHAVEDLVGPETAPFAKPLDVTSDKLVGEYDDGFDTLMVERRPLVSNLAVGRMVRRGRDESTYHDDRQGIRSSGRALDLADPYTGEDDCEEDQH